MMANLLSPTPEELKAVMALKTNRLNELNELPTWNDVQAEEVCSWLFNFNTAIGWVYDRQAVERFAFDPRLPDANASELQSILNNFKNWMCADDEYPTLLPLLHLLTATNL